MIANLIFVLLAYRSCNFLFFPLLLEKPHRQILGRIADKLKLVNYKLDLLYQLLRARGLPKLDCFYERRSKLRAKDVSSFDFKHIVAERY